MQSWLSSLRSKLSFLSWGFWGLGLLVLSVSGSTAVEGTLEERTKTSQQFANQILAQFAQAGPLELTISGGNSSQIPIGIADFKSDTSEGADLGRQIAKIIRNNLSRAGLVTAIDRDAHPASAFGDPASPNLPDWSGVGADNVITGSVTKSAHGRLTVQFFLWDTVTRRQLSALTYTTTANYWRRIGHLISDAVMKRITGEEGAFDTRIVYVAETGPKTDRTKQLAIMDQDGANHQFLTASDLFVTSPRFSPTSQEITYVGLSNGKWSLYLLNLDTGQFEVLANFNGGMPTSPRFSPSGDKLVATVSIDGNSDLYEIDLTTRETLRLTEHSSIDTAASYSADGKFIVFESDRSGSQQLYRLDRDTGQTRRISRGEGRYATPVWSPTGEWIAFTKNLKGQFYIGIMRIDGSDERLLASGFVAEGPTWAPNGRLLAYYKQAPTEFGDQMDTALYAVDLFTFTERLMMTPTDASDPAWSPLLR